jgi:hypothetical protein|tara:strand:- start:137 stop:331 length:195 start_codon:yes stop_codon:yes gene_type:complete
MAIFIYCDKCEKVMPLNECKHDVEIIRNNTKNYVNMRTTLSGTTKMEFNQTTLEEDIKSRGGSL